MPSRYINPKSYSSLFYYLKVFLFSYLYAGYNNDRGDHLLACTKGAFSRVTCALGSSFLRSPRRRDLDQSLHACACPRGYFCGTCVRGNPSKNTCRRELLRSVAIAPFPRRDATSRQNWPISQELQQETPMLPEMTSGFEGFVSFHGLTRLSQNAVQNAE